MKKIRIFATLFLILAICLTGCSNQSSKQVTLGEFNDNTYSNDYFGLTIDLDHDWYTLSREEINEVHNLGVEIIAESNEEMGKQADLSKQHSLTLFHISQHSQDHAQGTNANMFCVAENLKFAGVSAASSRDYIDILEKNLAAIDAFPIESCEISSEYIGGKSFDTLLASMEFQGLTIYQKYYALKHNHYILSIVSTYFSDADLSEIDGMLASVKFD